MFAQASMRIVPPRIGSIAFVTRDRPSALSRALDSYGHSIREHRPGSMGPRLTVFDDSRDPVTVAENKSCALAASRFGLDVAYAGAGDRAAVTQSLIAQGLSPEIAAFALLGPGANVRTVGANRNAILLDTYGSFGMSVDDDTECRMTVAPDLSDVTHLNGVEIVDPVFPCILENFKDRTTLMGTHVFVNGDLLAINEHFLGREVTAAKHGEMESDRSHRRLSANPSRTVRLTLPGLAGDCGWSSPMHYLWLAGDSFNNLTASAEHYRMACQSREVLRRVNRPTIIDTAMNMMSTFFGFDHRTLLPPFPPIGRGQDLIFGLLTSLTIEDGCVAHLPQALLHSPIESRTFRPRELVAGAIAVDLCIVLSACLMRAATTLSGNDVAGRLRCLGQYLEQMGTAAETDGNKELRDTVIDFMSERFEQLQERASDAALPVYWREDAREACRLWRLAMRQPAYHLPVEFLRGMNTQGALRTTLKFLAQFGALLCEWPQLVEQYDRLRRSGRHLAVAAKELAFAASPVAPE